MLYAYMSGNLVWPFELFYYKNSYWLYYVIYAVDNFCRFQYASYEQKTFFYVTSSFVTNTNNKTNKDCKPFDVRI